MKGITFGLLAFIVSLMAVDRCYAGASPLEALSLGVGIDGKWLDQGGEPSANDVEGAANLAIGITPHITVTGGVAYGINGGYWREQFDVRLAAIDREDNSFNVWVGAGRYWADKPADGLDEWAGKAGVGYRVPVKLPLVLGATAAYGLDTERRSFVVALSYVLKAAKGGSQ